MLQHFKPPPSLERLSRPPWLKADKQSVFVCCPQNSQIWSSCATAALWRLSCPPPWKDTNWVISSSRWSNMKTCSGWGDFICTVYLKSHIRKHITSCLVLSQLILPSVKSLINNLWNNELLPLWIHTSEIKAWISHTFCTFVCTGGKPRTGVLHSPF